MRKWIIWAIIIVAVLILGRLLIACGQQLAGPVTEYAATDANVPKIASAMAGAGQAAGTAGKSSSPSMPGLSVKALVDGPPTAITLEGFTRVTGETTWYRPPVTAGDPMTPQMQFRNAAGTGLNLGDVPTITLASPPSSILMKVSGSGFGTGETVTMWQSMSWSEFSKQSGTQTQTGTGEIIAPDRRIEITTMTMTVDASKHEPVSGYQEMRMVTAGVTYTGTMNITFTTTQIILSGKMYREGVLVATIYIVINRSTNQVDSDASYMIDSSGTTKFKNLKLT